MDPVAKLYKLRAGWLDAALEDMLSLVASILVRGTSFDRRERINMSERYEKAEQLLKLIRKKEKEKKSTTSG